MQNSFEFQPSPLCLYAGGRVAENSVRRFVGVPPKLVRDRIAYIQKKHNLRGYATAVGQMGKAFQFPSNGNAHREGVSLL